MRLRYGTNPHQDGSFTMPADNPEAIRVISGAPSYINMLDALNGWQLVREAAATTGTVVAASVKHVSPAGLAVAGDLDPATKETWSAGASPGPLTSAYIRARDTDPRSSFGDMIAVSEPVDTELAAFLRGVAADGIIAPGFEPGVTGQLAAKKQGSFLMLEADPSYWPAGREQRDVFGILLEQERDVVPLTADLLTGSAGAALPAAAARDALLGLAVTRHTQSNSVGADVWRHNSGRRGWPAEPDRLRPAGSGQGRNVVAASSFGDRGPASRARHVAAGPDQLADAAG